MEGRVPRFRLVCCSPCHGPGNTRRCGPLCHGNPILPHSDRLDLRWRIEEDTPEVWDRTCMMRQNSYNSIRTYDGMCCPMSTHFTYVKMKVNLQLPKKRLQVSEKKYVKVLKLNELGPLQTIFLLLTNKQLWCIWRCG